jgi:transcriptional regulator with XRE-family HTH domain
VKGQRRSGQTDLVVGELKRLLRDRRLRYGDVAAALGVSQTTVKRWLTKGPVTISLLESLCALIGIGVAELFELANRDQDRRLRRLSEDQEDALTSDRHLSFLFYLILQGWSPQELQREFGLPEPSLVKYLVQLDKLRLIDLLPGNRVKLLTMRQIEWRQGGPTTRSMNRHVKRLFADVDYSDPSASWQVEIGKLSAASRAQLDEKFRMLKLEVRHLAETDRTVPADRKEWYAVLVVGSSFQKSSMVAPATADPWQHQ